MAVPPKVNRHPQPLGKGGIAHSLDSVSKKAIEGGKDEVVRAWATHILSKCGFPKGALERAKCALADTRLYPWIPDPVDVEFIPAPRLMMPNLLTGEGAVYLADDCDGLTARWLALCLAMGIRAQVVGYSFEDDKQITHVLGSIWDDVAGKWVDGDPSFQDMPLGQTQPHTWEQRRDLPSMEITCDDTACDLSRAPNTAEGYVDFLSVGKPAPSTVGALPSPEDIATEFLSLADDIDAHWNDLKAMYDAMRATFTADGLVKLSDLAAWGWSAENNQRAIDLGVMATVSARYLRDAAAGIRTIWVAESQGPAMAGLAEITKEKCLKTGGSFDAKTVECACPKGTTFDFFGDGCVNAQGVANEQSWAIERKPEDVFGVELGPNDEPILVNAQGIPTHGASNTLGLGPAAVVGVAAAAAVIYVAVAYAIVKALQAAADIARTVTDTYLESRTTECYKPDSGVSKEECDKRVAERREYQLKKLEAEKRLHETEGDPTPSLVKTADRLIYVGGAVLTIYGLVKLVGALTENKRTAKAVLVFKTRNPSCDAPRSRPRPLLSAAPRAAPCRGAASEPHPPPESLAIPAK